MAELFASDELRNLKNLQLALSSSRRVLDDEVSDNELDRITRKLSKLESLSISSWERMGTERTFRILSSNCPNLISLKIGSHRLGDEVVAARANHFWPNLKHLEISKDRWPGF
jgi:hypothetical protein